MSTAAAANIPWYLSRATGLAAYCLLFATVVLGLSVRTKALDKLSARWRITDIHTFLSVLVVLFVIVHAAVLLGDTFIGFSVVQLLVPFASSYLPLWTGLGIIMAYLLLLIALSFPARRFIGYRAWRALHYLTFLIYVGALVHALFTGTDSRAGWTQVIYELTAGIVLLLVIYRLVTWSRQRLAALMPRPIVRLPAGLQRPARAVVPATLSAEEISRRRESIETRALALGFSAVVIGVIIFLAAGIGPFRWGQGRSAAASSAAAAPARAAPAATLSNFQDSYTGNIRQRRGQLDVQITGSGQFPLSLEIQLQLVDDGQGGTTVTGNSATLADAAGATICNGQVASMDNSGFEVDCQGTGADAGQQIRVLGSIDSGSGNQIQGTLRSTGAVGSGQ